MAEGSLDFKKEKPSEEWRNRTEEKPGSTPPEDHPILGGERKPLKKELLRFPERPKPDPMIHFPADPSREASRKAFESGALPHDPSIDYQTPNPQMVIPPTGATLKILGAIAAITLLTMVMWLIFHNFMSPLPRHPGQQKQGQGLEQKIP